MKKFLFAWLFTLLLLGNVAMIAADGTGTDAAPAYAAYNGRRLGVLTGPLMEGAARENFPDSEILLFNSYPDCITALLSNKIDAYLGDELGVQAVCMERPDIGYIPEHIAENNYSFAFRKNDQKSAALCEELNTFLEKCWSDGTIEELEDIWFGEDEARKVVDMSDLTGEKGTLKVVTTSTDPPFSFIKNGKNVGYDIDLIVRFCRERGCKLVLGDVDFAGRIPAVESGKYDFTTDMNVTAEREEQVLFSDPVCNGGIVLAVRASDIKASSAGSADSGTQFSEPSTAGSTGGENLRPQDFVGKRIAVQTGTIAGEVAQAVIGDVQLDYYNTQVDAMTALRAGKADAWSTDEPIARFLLIENTDLELIEEKLDSSSLAAVFPKTDAGHSLCDQYSAFVESLWADGTMEEIDAKWFGTDEDRRTVLEYEKLPDTNGTLRMAVDVSLVPFAIMKDNRVVGYDVDIAARFCQANGYRLEVVPMDFAGVLPSVQTGKADFAATGITVTKERAESVLFSSENYKSGTSLVVRKDKAAAAESGPVSKGESAVTASSGEEEDTSFFGRIKSSFIKTFIREDRWQLFVNGIFTTLLITVLAILLGTLLGFGVFLACRNGNRAVNLITRFCLWLVQGMPVVVLLMILFYIVFGSISISGIAVAVIGFTLTFGAAVFGLLKMGVGAVDNGQYEAAYALGYSNRKTFFKIILPQALPHVLPAYKGEIVGLIKATAVVGYIAVQDLTKMGDIVRSRTYEAFFPLIAVTVFYFLLEGLIGLLVGRISVNVNPKRRKPADILKGVKTDD